MAYAEETSCCGLEEIVSVGGSSRASIISAIKAAREHRAGRVFATTTSGQEVAIERLKELGFRAIDEFRNPNTGNRVTIWLRSTAPVPPRPIGRIAKLTAAVKR